MVNAIKKVSGRGEYPDKGSPSVLLCLFRSECEGVQGEPFPVAAPMYSYLAVVKHWHFSHSHEVTGMV
jgi:hypothetical protein